MLKMLNKLSSEGWKMSVSFTGDIAKMSGFKSDVIIFTRVRNDKLPPPPEF